MRTVLTAGDDGHKFRSLQNFIYDAVALAGCHCAIPLHINHYILTACSRHFCFAPNAEMARRGTSASCQNPVSSNVVDLSEAEMPPSLSGMSWMVKNSIGGMGEFCGAVAPACMSSISFSVLHDRRPRIQAAANKAEG